VGDLVAGALRVVQSRQDGGCRILLCNAARIAIYAPLAPDLLAHVTRRTFVLLSPASIIPALTQHQQRWKARAAVWRRLQMASLGFAPGGLGPTGADLDPGFNHLAEIYDFGSNPGALRMFTYVPVQPPQNPALVVVLHGCAQTAASYDLGVGWSTLADRYGFVVLLPQQQLANNPNNCFNWFLPEDTARGVGEALSIRQMIAAAITTHRIDRARVFITGLSAGGAMTSVMLAAYPELFAGGAVIAGLPYGTAANVNEAMESMFHVRARSSREWGDLVRAASRHRGPWPRISVWHGTADTVVKADNADEIVKQWTDVHGLEPAPALTEMVDGHPRQVWRRRDGREIVELYSIAGMAHGAPLATGSADCHCGIPGAFVLDVGISSSYHIAKFWGLTARRRDVEALRAAANRLSRPGPKWIAKWLRKFAGAAVGSR
jgi:poly(hydroxyalkanoate) depolymerase family esterase